MPKPLEKNISISPQKGKLYSFNKPTSLYIDQTGCYDFFSEGCLVLVYDIRFDNRVLKVWFLDQDARLNWVPYSNFGFWLKPIPIPSSEEA
jgi:hypothetical protein